MTSSSTLDVIVPQVLYVAKFVCFFPSSLISRILNIAPLCFVFYDRGIFCFNSAINSIETFNINEIGQHKNHGCVYICQSEISFA